MSTEGDAYRRTVVMIMDHLIANEPNLALYAYLVSIGIHQWDPTNAHRMALVDMGFGSFKGMPDGLKEVILDCYEPRDDGSLGIKKK